MTNLTLSRVRRHAKGDTAEQLAEEYEVGVATIWRALRPFVASAARETKQAGVSAEVSWITVFGAVMTFVAVLPAGFLPSPREGQQFAPLVAPKRERGFSLPIQSLWGCPRNAH